MEYLTVRRGGAGQTFVYQLCVDLEGMDLHPNRAGSEGDCAGGARPDSGGMAGSVPDGEWPVSMRAGAASSAKSPERTDTGAGEKSADRRIVASGKPVRRAQAVGVK